MERVDLEEHLIRDPQFTPAIGEGDLEVQPALEGVGFQPDPAELAPAATVALHQEVLTQIALEQGVEPTSGHRADALVER